jgi:hypothetical protein
MNEPLPGPTTTPTALPQTLESCHAMIRDLQSQLNDKTRLIVRLMGYDPTDTEVFFGCQQTLSQAMGKVDPALIESELAAEDAMRRRRRPRKKI